MASFAYFSLVRQYDSFAISCAHVLPSSDWVHGNDNTAGFPDEKKTLCSSLGPSRDHGSAMGTKIIKHGQMPICFTFILVSGDEMQQAETAPAMQELTVNKAITSPLGESATLDD